MPNNKVRTGKNIVFSNKGPLVLIAGPCVIESRESCFQITTSLKKICARSGIKYVFKASYDKANRTSYASYRGPGIEKGLEILKAVKDKFDVPVLTDVHSIEEVRKVSVVADILQIPAFLCRQTDLLIAAAKTGKIVNVKKGQFLSPWDMKNVVKKIESAGNKNILLTERGSSFGYNNLVADMRSIVVMKETGCPVIFDATHSVQLPGGQGGSSGGNREFVEPLSKAAASIGIAGLFLEVHPDPDKALSDGPNSIAMNNLEKMLKNIAAIDKLIKNKRTA